MPIATIVHVSDLHFGMPDASRGGSAEPIPIGELHSGCLGHHIGPCEGLMDFWEDLLSGRDPQEVIFINTGDISAFGMNAQLDIGRSFVEGSFDFNGAYTVGLQTSPDKHYRVPGNHDQWPGYAFPIPYKGYPEGPKANQIAYHFGTMPLVSGPLPVGGGVTLRIIRLDTDADVRPISRSRFMAKGLFESQLGQISEELAKVGPREPEEVRILVLHHCRSFQHRGTTLMMGKDSKRALDNFVVANEISVLLSGHIHRPRLSKSRIEHEDGRIRRALEARCGTTTQHTEVPPLWNRWRRRALPHNTLLVHQLDSDGSHATWSTQTYVALPTNSWKFLRPVEVVHGFVDDLEISFRLW